MIYLGSTMKILYLDCTSGISGDMTLAALLDLGVDKEYLLAELKKLNVDGYEIIIQKKERHSILMMDVDVKLTELENETAHAHHHNYEPEQGGDHEYNHNHGHCHSHGERNLDSINKIIDESGITQKAKEMSKRIFKEIATAEARVHGKPVEDVHFHEVGAIDSIVDIVGVAVGDDAVNPDKIDASTLHDCHGNIQCRH